MNLLTDDEIYTAYIEAANQTLRPQDERIALAFARAIEKAVLSKLAQGVSVEPVIRGWMNPANGVVIDPQRKKQIGVGDGYPNFSVPLYDESGTVTRKQLQTAIAAARVAALEDAAKLVAHIGFHDVPHHHSPSTAKCARAIRALIGEES